nr:hypothetical protein [Tanacetum cinerariifolium]
MVSYTSISSPERSWDIPDVDPYEEAALQAIEQVAPPLSPAYLPDPIELHEHVPVYVLEPEYLEYLEPPANDIEEDLEEEDLEDESDDNASSEEEPSKGSNDTEPSEEDETAVTPPPSRLHGARISIRPQTPMPPLSEARVAELLAMPTPPPSPLTPMSSSLPQIPSPPLPVPSPPPILSSPLPPPVPVETHAPEQDVEAALLMLLSTTRRSEVGESSGATAARPPRDLYGFVDTTELEASITHRHARTLHDTKRRMMTVVELVNLRVSYEAQTRQRDAEGFHSQLRDAQRDRTGIRAEIVALRYRGTLFKDAYIELHEDLLRSQARNESLEAYNRTQVARIETIETRMTEMKDQFQDTRDRTSIKFYGKIMSATRQGTSNNMTLEFVQAMIDQAMQRNSTNGDGSHSSGGGPTRPAQYVRTCSYSDFMKCQPLNFRGTKGVVGLSRWFEKIESVIHISDCAVENKETLKKKLMDKYYPKGKIKKLDIKLWNLKFLADETEKVDKYINGLPDNIHGNVMSARPKTLNEAIELANDLMDQKLRTYAERQNDNKMKADDSSRNNQQQQPHKKQNVAKAYTTGPGEKKAYTGNLPLCTKCKYHHTGQCAPKCNNYKKYGHAIGDCQVIMNNNNNNNNMVQNTDTCFECGEPGHFKKNCLKLKNNGNANKNDEARGKAYVLDGGDSNPESNTVTGTFLPNNRYASILFDTGADRSFVSTAFCALLNIAPTALDNHYDVELADGNIIGVNTILRGCTLDFLNHLFNIDLMPVPLGSFDVIIGMDWLREY